MLKLEVLKNSLEEQAGYPDCWWPGPRFNIKMLSYQYRKSHCGDKTVVRSSYLHNGISHTGKMTSLYWFSPLAPNITRWPAAMILTMQDKEGSCFSWWRISTNFGNSARRSVKKAIICLCYPNGLSMTRVNPIHVVCSVDMYTYLHIEWGATITCSSNNTILATGSP